MKYDIVLWDMDRTLLVPEEAEKPALRATFSEFGFGECSEENLGLYKSFNDKWWNLAEAGEYKTEDIVWLRFQDFLKHCGVDSSRAREFAESYMEKLGDYAVFVPGARETLSALKGKVRQYIVTNGVKTSQESKVYKSGIGEYVDGVFISTVVGADKPSPVFFDRVLSSLGVEDRSRVLMVGDSLTTDVPGAIASSIPILWFNPKGKERPQGMDVDYEVRDIRDVLEIVLDGNS